MTGDLYLRRKWTLRAHGHQVVFVKKPLESVEHVVMKALLWALYLPEYPALTVEVAVGDRYKPDVVALDGRGEPVFWGEAGDVSVQKIRSLSRRYRSTHFAIGRWEARVEPMAELVWMAIAGLDRSAPFDVICFPADSTERFMDDDGEIHVSHADLGWRRLRRYDDG